MSDPKTQKALIEAMDRTLARSERGPRASSEFDDSRDANWRRFLDQDGRPTSGPERTLHGGCHYCEGALDATKTTGGYECPWCIARFPDARAAAPPQDPPEDGGMNGLTDTDLEILMVAMENRWDKDPESMDVWEKLVSEVARRKG